MGFPSKYGREMTNERCLQLIEGYGYHPNPMKGLKGSFYTENRLADLMLIVRELIDAREA